MFATWQAGWRAARGRMIRGFGVRCAFGRPLMLVTVASLALSGCTAESVDPPEAPPPPASDDDDASAPSGVAAAFVLPARSVTSRRSLSELERTFDALQRMHEPDIRSIRALVPETPEFVADLAAYSGQGAPDLTCVIGAEGGPIILQMARLYPADRFCGVIEQEPEEPSPEGVDFVVVRFEELGHALGAVAANAATSPVLLALGPSERERRSFVDGLTAGLAGRTAIPLDREVEPAAAVASAVDAGAQVVVVGTGVEASAVIEAARSAGLIVIGPREFAAVEDAPLTVAWRVRWDVVFDGPVHRLLGHQEEFPASLGLVEGAFDVQVVPSGPPALGVVLQRILQDLASGARDPFELIVPPVEESDPDASDPAGPDDDAADEQPAAASD